MAIASLTHGCGPPPFPPSRCFRPEVESSARRTSPGWCVWCQSGSGDGVEHSPCFTLTQPNPHSHGSVEHSPYLTLTQPNPHSRDGVEGLTLAYPHPDPHPPTTSTPPPLLTESRGLVVLPPCRRGEVREVLLSGSVMLRLLSGEWCVGGGEWGVVCGEDGGVYAGVRACGVGVGRCGGVWHGVCVCG